MTDKEIELSLKHIRNCLKSLVDNEKIIFEIFETKLGYSEHIKDYAKKSQSALTELQESLKKI